MRRGSFFIGICLVGLICLTGCGKEEKEKIQLTYSTCAPTAWDAITEFNRTNDTYEIVCALCGQEPICAIFSGTSFAVVCVVK